MYICTPVQPTVQEFAVKAFCNLFQYIVVSLVFYVDYYLYCLGLRQLIIDRKLHFRLSSLVQQNKINELKIKLKQYRAPASVSRRKAHQRRCTVP